MSKLKSVAEIEERAQRPHPIIEIESHEEKQPHYDIKARVIDAFDRDGHKEVERRVATQYNNYSINKKRIMLVGDEAGCDLFLDNIFGNEERKKSRHFEGISTARVLDSFDGVYESRKLTQQLIDEIELSWCTGSPITTVVNCWQDGHDKYLEMAVTALPEVTFYNLCYADPTGKGRSFEARFGSVNDVWDTRTDVENEKDLPPVINGIAHEGESTWLGALPKVGKTWVLLCILLALLTGMPLFGDERLTVPRKAKRCIYLCPEASRGSIKKRLKMLGLVEHLYDPITNPDGRLYLQTLSKGRKIALTDPLLLELVVGADIFVDTAVRYLEGDENAVKDVRVLTENILNLLAVGARSVWVAHHAPKGFENASSMTLQNMFRGSGEFGAALTNAYGLCTEDEATTKVRLHCICGRDLDEPIPDMILQGRPYLHDTGNFKIVDVDAAPRKAGAPGDALKQQKIDFARSVSGSMQEKADGVNTQFGTKHSRSTIYEWLKEASSFDVEVNR